MDPGDLTTDELEYELAIRKIQLGSNRRNNCLNLRNALREELRGKKSPPTFTTEILDPKDEMVVIEEKLDELQDYLEEFSDNLVVTAQALSRLEHVSSRFKRIEPSKIEGIQHYRAQSRLRALKQKFEEWKTNTEAKLNEKPKKTKNTRQQEESSSPLLPQIPEPLNQFDENDDYESLAEKYKKLLSFVTTFQEELAKPISGTRSHSFAQPNRTTEENQDHRGTRTEGYHNSQNSTQIPHVQFGGTTSYDNRPPNFSSEPPNSSLQPPNFGRGPPNSSMGPRYSDFSGYRTGNADESQFYASVNHRRNVVHKWRIEFRGDENGISLNDFISQVEHFQKAEAVSDAELRDSVIHLLKGQALTWYRAFHNEYPSWPDLKYALRKEFLPGAYQHYLRQEIEARVQGEDEKFSVFLASMEMLFKNLAYPISEAEKIDILRRNMHPELAEKFAVFSIRSIPELSSIVKNLESVRYAAQRRNSQMCRPLEPAFSTPQKPRFVRKVHLVEQDEDSAEDDQVAAVERYVKRSENRRSASKSTAPDAQTETPELSGTANREVLKCWNCEEKGHNFRDCLKERRQYFCYNCGNKGVTSSRCPICRNLGNSKGGRQ
jgi:hypothetical protein